MPGPSAAISGARSPPVGAPSQLEERAGPDSARPLLGDLEAPLADFATPAPSGAGVDDLPLEVFIQGRLWPPSKELETCMSAPAASDATLSEGGGSNAVDIKSSKESMSLWELMDLAA